MKTNRVADKSSEPYRGPDGRQVQRMFGEIAHRYDFLNHLLSASVDRRWRRLAVATVAEYVRRDEGMRCLDLCTGTGDLAIELHKRLRVAVVASDFSHPMLVRSVAKTRDRRLQDTISIVEADAMDIPFRSASFNAVTIAFGLRNLQDPQLGLTEMRRVLQPDGAAVILEFSRPVVPLVRHVFQFYFHRILPRIGAWVSGQRTAYNYLPESVDRFPTQFELASMMEKAGFRNVGFRNLSGGIAALHWGIK